MWLEKLYGYFYPCLGDLICFYNASIPLWDLRDD